VGRRGGLATLVITEQQGRTFAGRLKRANPTGDEEEPLWGAFTPGARLMMGSDDEHGPVSLSWAALWQIPSLLAETTRHCFIALEV
jgi:hypothetical protein